MNLRELAMLDIAYNLLRLVMTAAALPYDVEPNQLSFKGTLNAFQAYAAKLEGTRCNLTGRKEIYDALHEVVANDPLPKRLGRIEPRTKKRRPKNFQLLTKLRKKMMETPHVPMRSLPWCFRQTREALNADSLATMGVDDAFVMTGAMKARGLLFVIEWTLWRSAGATGLAILQPPRFARSTGHRSEGRCKLF